MKAKQKLKHFRGKRIDGIPRPLNPGDLCWKCGTATRFQETKQEPKPHQTFAYLGYLKCPNCSTMYLCDQFKYEMDDRPGLFPHF